MNLIFLSTSDYVYVYLDIFLMGLHLSSTDWKEGRERGSQSKKEREAGGHSGSGNERVTHKSCRLLKMITADYLFFFFFVQERVN